MRVHKDQVSSLFLLIVSGIILASSIKASVGSLEEPGSGMIPFLAASLMGIFSLSGLVLATMSNSREQERTAFREINWKNLGATLTSLLAFPFVLRLLGFDLTVFGFILFLAKATEPRRWVIAVLFALGTTAACHLVFIYWLKLSLEKGIFGI
jgi:Tripartite tricarboxylate transporter TctB family